MTRPDFYQGSDDERIAWFAERFGLEQPFGPACTPASPTDGVSAFVYLWARGAERFVSPLDWTYVSGLLRDVRDRRGPDWEKHRDQIIRNVIDSAEYSHTLMRRFAQLIVRGETALNFEGVMEP